MIEHFLENVLRRGVVPFCCGGASVCFAFYSFRVSSAAKQWAVLDSNESIHNNDDGRLFSEYAERLDQHARTCETLSLVSAAITYESFKDWRDYRTLPSLDKMERWIISRPIPFFVRIPVILSTVLSFIYLERVNGGSQFSIPTPRPLIITKTTTTTTTKEIFH
mmetsp:Transcript_40311/g.45872  ORF Transcript_40311/g.45872 Transcript_40311/m.45872 type:complete len:164 (-) Transcript_40311:98-589(-)